jgi:hypothetical protein
LLPPVTSITGSRHLCTLGCCYALAKEGDFTMIDLLAFALVAIAFVAPGLLSVALGMETGQVAGSA